MRPVRDVDDEIAFLLGEDQKASLMGGAYEAADRYDRQLATWTPPIQGPDADILPDKSLADARALDIMRNDAFAAAGSTLHKDNIVGAMFMLNAKPNTAVLGLDEVWAEEFQQEVEAKFTTWGESFNHWADAAGRNTFTAMIRLAVGVYVVSGEVLATSEWLRPTRRPFRTAIQMVELNRLCDPQDQIFDQERVRGGVEVDSRGAPIAYYIRRASPGHLLFSQDSYRWSRIRARNSFGRPQVFHIFEQQRPGQTRGISQLVAALKEMRTTKRFRDITLQNAVVNASFAAAIESELPSQAVFESVGGGNVGEVITSYATDYLGAVAKYAGNSRNMHIDGVKIPHFFPGTKLSLHPMGTPGGVGTEFEAGLLRYIAANLDVSYEELSRDYSQTNYSSARAGMLGTWKAAQSRKKMVADRFATLIYRNWFEEAVNAGEIEALKGRSIPNIYDSLAMEAYTRCDWIGAARGMIDELKETQASILRIKQGLTTYEDELGRQGKDWRATFRQMKREQDLMDELGIAPEEANAINAASGDVREASNGEADEPRGTDDDD